MYERFFQLRERPFALSPDPDYLYPSRVHREALGYLRYGIESHAGFVVITGEIGSGKTTLLQALLRGLDRQTTVVRLMNTLLEPRELLEAIAIDLGIVPTANSKPALLHELATRLVDERMAGRIVLLVIDEAQNLGSGALEEIRMLSNLETEKSKLLQVVLVGQPDLRDLLNLPELEQLRQRITVSYHLEPLDADETEAYVNHRLRRAALGAPLQFSREVTNRVHERAHGVPRLVNVICDATLVFAYAEERRTIDVPLVDEVLAELETTGVLRTPEAQAAKAPPVERPAWATGAPEPPRRVEVVRPSVPAPSVDAEQVQGLLDRETAVRMKEEQLSRRERQLAEQQRVLAEEYRLFRDRQTREMTIAAVEPRPDRGMQPWPSRMSAERDEQLPGSSHARASVSAPMAPAPMTAAPMTAATVLPFDASGYPDSPPRRRFWRRVKQVLLGEPQAVLEDR